MRGTWIKKHLPDEAHKAETALVAGYTLEAPLARGQGFKEYNMINWHTSKEDTNLILAIVLRAERMGIMVDDRMTLMMDITACHNCGTPLRLADLLTAADGDCIHDVTGIRTHMNRETGQLQDGFLPRYAMRDSKVVA